MRGVENGGFNFIYKGMLYFLKSKYIVFWGIFFLDIFFKMKIFDYKCIRFGLYCLVVRILEMIVVGSF